MLITVNGQKMFWTEFIPLPEHKHVEILDRGGLWKVDNNVTLIFKVPEYHLKTITSVPTTKIDCKGVVSILMKVILPMKRCPKSKVNQLIQLLIKNILEDLLTVYIRVRTFSFAKGQIQSHKINQSRLKSRSVRTSLKKMDFENSSNSNHKNSYFYSYKYLKNKNGSFFLIFSLFALVLIKIRRKKQEKLFWSVCLIYLLFLKTVKLLNSIASHNKQKQRK